MVVELVVSAGGDNDVAVVELVVSAGSSGRDGVVGTALREVAFVVTALAALTRVVLKVC